MGDWCLNILENIIVIHTDARKFLRSQYDILRFIKVFSHHPINKCTNIFLERSTIIAMSKQFQLLSWGKSILPMRTLRQISIFCHCSSVKSPSMDKQWCPGSIDVHMFQPWSKVITFSRLFVDHLQWVSFRFLSHSISSSLHERSDFTVFSRRCLSVHLCR